MEERKKVKQHFTSKPRFNLVKYFKVEQYTTLKLSILNGRDYHLSGISQLDFCSSTQNNEITDNFLICNCHVGMVNMTSKQDQCWPKIYELKDK